MDRACRPALPGKAASGVAAGAAAGAEPAARVATASEAGAGAARAARAPPGAAPPPEQTPPAPRDLGAAHGGGGGRGREPPLAPLSAGSPSSGAQPPPQRLQETRSRSPHRRPEERPAAAAAEAATALTTAPTHSSLATGGGHDSGAATQVAVLSIRSSETPCMRSSDPERATPSPAGPSLAATPSPFPSPFPSPAHCLTPQPGPSRPSVRFDHVLLPSDARARDKDTVRRVKKRALQRQLLRLQERLYRHLFDSESDTDGEARSLSASSAGAGVGVGAGAGAGTEGSTVASSSCAATELASAFSPEASPAGAGQTLSSPSVCSHGDRRLAEGATPRETGDARAVEVEVNADGEGATAGSSSDALSRAYAAVEPPPPAPPPSATAPLHGPLHASSSSLSFDSVRATRDKGSDRRRVPPPVADPCGVCIDLQPSNREPIARASAGALSSHTPAPAPAPDILRSPPSFTVDMPRAVDASEQFCQLWEAICDLERRIRLMESDERVNEPPEFVTEATERGAAETQAGGRGGWARLRGEGCRRVGGRGRACTQSGLHYAPVAERTARAPSTPLAIPWRRCTTRHLPLRV